MREDALAPGFQLRAQCGLQLRVKLQPDQIGPFQAKADLVVQAQVSSRVIADRDVDQLA